MLCDPRITTRSYGKTFVKILDPMPATDSFDEVERFFARHERPGAVA